MSQKTAVRNYQGLKFSHREPMLVSDALVEEEKLEILINSKAFTTTMCSPGMEEELARGLLFSEDVYRGPSSEIKFDLNRWDNQNVSINAMVPDDLLGQGYLNGRSLLSVSSCGICGKTELEFLHSEAISNRSIIQAEDIPKMFSNMESKQDNWSLSGGSHAAAIYGVGGERLSLAEDIGRHNAVDKSIGTLLYSNTLQKSSILLVSSRISYEIVAKCFTAGIPCLAAVSAPSSLAVDFAKELGITLIAFCRDGRFTVYSHPARVAQSSSHAVLKSELT